MHIVDTTVIILYFLFIALVGYIARRKVKTQNDFFLGGQRFKKFMMSMMFFGAGTNTDQVVAVTSKIYQVGLSGIWYQWLYLFISPFYWLKLPIVRRLRMMTTADFFKERYSKSLGICYAVIGTITVAVNIGLMLKGTGFVIDAISLHQLPANWAILAVAALFVFYGVLGGLVAAVWTDAIQGMLTLVLSFLLIPFMLVKVGGMSSLHYQLEQVRGLTHAFSLVSPGDISVLFIFTITLNGLVGMFTQPQVMQTGGSCKTEMDGRTGSLVGTVLKRVCTVAWAFIGVGAIYLFPGLSHPDLAFGEMIRALLPVGLMGLMVAAILAAVMSSCDVLMVTGTALFIRNIYRNIITRELTEEKFLLISRFVSVGVVLLGIIIAFLLPGVVAGLELFWKLNAFTGFAFWAGLVWKRANVSGAWASIIGSVTVWITLEMLGASLPVQMLSYIGAGFILLVIVSLLTGKYPSRDTERFYRKLRTPIGADPELDVIR
ncbi:MAG: sodium:solute symporter family protein [Fidelibacterota bacterium]|nr:MAG: sodium:solute symporter family protein [Candidatus Neomarinimicrobiota bacterium]